MNPKTTIPMIICGMLLASACRQEEYSLPPTQPDDPGEAVIEEELAPPEEPEEMRTIPEGEAIDEDYYEEQEAE
jgi:hypothetical protein